MKADRTPIACSLEVLDAHTRQQEWEHLLTHSLIARAAIPDGVSLRLRASPDAVTEVRRLIDLERDCCGWINWSIVEGKFAEVRATAS